MEPPLSIVVGAPIHQREWIIEQWVDHISIACENAHVEPIFLVVMDPRDEPTASLLQNRCKVNFHELYMIFCEEDRATSDRVWNIDRYRRMVYLRNQLLTGVRQLDPQFFLSIDSDILLHPDAVVNMLDTMYSGDWGAVGSKVFLSNRGTRHPNYAKLTKGGNLQRSDSDGVFQVDVLMALKLMSRRAYAVDYEEHNHGEDIGISLAWKRAGVKLAWSGAVASKHVMSKNAMAVIDDRVGY
jgi:hypothetical protein